MPAALEDVERLAEAVKRLLTERRKMAKLGDKCLRDGLSSKQAQKASTDLNWQAMGVAKVEAEVHAAAVDCGLADLREPEHYATRDLNPSPRHRYRWTPPRPRSEQAA